LAEACARSRVSSCSPVCEPSSIPTPSPLPLETAIIADGPDQSDGSTFFGTGAGLQVIQLQPEVAMGDGQGAGRQLLPRRSMVQLFGGEECGPSAETGLRVGAAGARAKEILPGFEAPAQRSSLVPAPFGPKIGRFRQNSELLVKNPRKRLRTRRQQDSLWSETRCNLHIHSLRIG
jgi:hypothetical protein